MTRVAIYCLQFVVCLLLCTGCLHYPDNPHLGHYDADVGYRFGNLPDAQNPKDPFIVLCFSGGGTRAAAFSYGVMEKLRETRDPSDRAHTLLDKVAVISSVSGGSFTAAYYAIHRDKLFTDFSKKFLKRDIEGELIWYVLNPLNAWRLPSPYLSRIDLASEFYEKEIFGSATFGDLAAARCWPYVILNSTDMTQGSRFEFTQEQFDLLYSDLSQVKVARAVTASSAYPVFLAPITMNNYADRPGFSPPPWLHEALNSREESPRLYARGMAIQAYLDPSNKPFVHLLDGGIADNLGTRGIYQSIEYKEVIDEKQLSIRRLVESGKIKHLVVILVNAQPVDSDKRDLSATTPCILDVLEDIVSKLMDNYSFDSEELLRRSLASPHHKEDAKPAPMGDAAMSNPTTLNREAGQPDNRWVALRKYYMDISFDALDDPVERQYLAKLDTNFHLSDRDVDHLRMAGARLLLESAGFKELMKELTPQEQVPATQAASGAVGTSERAK